jgi:hypothetical protein
VTRLINFLILLSMSLYLTNLTLEDGSSASLVFPQSVVQANTVTTAGNDESLSPTINATEAEELIRLLPAIKELCDRGMEVKWEGESASMGNNKDYYFFGIYNAAAQKAGNTGLIGVGNYAVNKHTADVRVWQVLEGVSFGDDGSLVTTNEIRRLQEELRKKHGIDFKIIQEFRAAHLAQRIITKEDTQPAMCLLTGLREGPEQRHSNA